MDHHARGMSLSAAVILLAYSVSLFTPATIASEMHRMLANAAIGVSLGVPPNPYNTLAQELSQKQSELDDRERRVASLEDELRKSQALERYLAFGSLFLSTCLFMLVGLNFYLDSRRGKRAETAGYAVNLRR